MLRPKKKKVMINKMTVENRIGGCLSLFSSDIFYASFIASNSFS